MCTVAQQTRIVLLSLYQTVAQKAQICRDTVVVVNIYYYYEIVHEVQI